MGRCSDSSSKSIAFSFSGAMVCLIALLGTMVVGSFGMATEFVVEFDLNVVGGVNGRVVPAHLQESDWTTVGHARGSTLENVTGGEIKAIWMKVPPGGHTFTVGPAGGGDAFDAVWRKTDGSELLFLDGHVPRNGFFWNRVVPRNLTNPFRGRAYHAGQAPPPPDPAEWERVERDDAPDRGDISPARQGLKNRLARSADCIRAYADFPDKTKLVWLSERGFPYVYDRRSDRIDPVLMNGVFPEDVDHVAAALNPEGGIDVVLSQAGRTVAKGTWTESRRQADAQLQKDAVKEAARIYFSGPNVFDLQRGEFVFTLFDFPAAVSFRVKARFDREDETYYYYKSAGVGEGDEMEWAFTIEPARAFDGHRIRRKSSSTGEWEELTDRVYMTIPRSGVKASTSFKACADFSPFPDDHPFPDVFSYSLFQFEKLGGGGKLFVNESGSERGLQFPSGGLGITPPAETPEIELKIGTFAGEATVEALDADGSVIDVQKASADNAFQVMTLKAPAGKLIASLRITGGGNEGLVGYVCTTLKVVRD